MRDQLEFTSATRPKLSFVIPAFNEERLIRQTLAEIHRCLHGAELSYEVIVADHGSDDATPQIAAGEGATVVRHPMGTIGALRNAGVQRTTGDVIIFLDADVRITPEWTRNLPDALNLIHERSKTVTGSMCGVSGRPGWIERYWFQPRLQRATHVGSGHMIISRRFFEELGGFDEVLETGEDYELCVRAKGAGGQIVLNPRLAVTHEGFPRTIFAFVKREAWHGAGDFTSIGAILQSKVAIAVIAFMGIHVAMLVAVLSGALWLGFASIIGGIFLCALSSITKFGMRSVRVFSVTLGLFYCYYLGRTLSVARVLLPNRQAKRIRVS